MKSKIVLLAVLMFMSATIVSAAWYLKCREFINYTDTSNCGSPFNACPGTCYVHTYAINLAPPPPYGLPPVGLPPGSVGGICTMASFYNWCTSITPAWLVAQTTWSYPCMTTASSCQCNTSVGGTIIGGVNWVADCF